MFLKPVTVREVYKHKSKQIKTLLMIIKTSLFAVFTFGCVVQGMTLEQAKEFMWSPDKQTSPMSPMQLCQ